MKHYYYKVKAGAHDDGLSLGGQKTDPETLYDFYYRESQVAGDSFQSTYPNIDRMSIYQTDNGDE